MTIAPVLAVMIGIGRSEVRQIACTRTAPQVVACVHSHTDYFWSTQTTATATNPTGAMLRDRRPSRDQLERWIALSTPAGEVSVTTTMAAYFYEDQVRATAALDRFVRDPERASMSVAIGTRWGGWYAAVVALALMFAAYAWRGQRVVLTNAPDRDALTVRTRVWPRRAQEATLVLPRVLLDSDEQGKRFRPMLVADDSVRVPIGSHGSRGSAERLLRRIQEFLGAPPTLE
jgi:hypothetical protein